jgi:histidinol dehydrogenase
MPTGSRRQLHGSIVAASSLFDPAIEQRTRAIVEAVRLRGDQAVLEYTERFDGARLTPDQLPVTAGEFLNASLKADDILRQAIAMAAKNIAAFGRKSLRKGWSSRNAQGRATCFFAVHR